MYTTNMIGSKRDHVTRQLAYSSERSAAQSLKKCGQRGHAKVMSIFPLRCIRAILPRTFDVLL